MTGPRKPAIMNVTDESLEHKPDIEDFIEPVTDGGAVKPTEEELAARKAEKYGDEPEFIEPEFIEPEAPEAVTPTDSYHTLKSWNDGGSDWWVGQPCRNCGKVGYRWTVGLGVRCSRCDEVEEE